MSARHQEVDLSEAREILDQLVALRREVEREGIAQFEKWKSKAARLSLRVSALNLAEYLALRRRDLRELQQSLREWGLSSLGRCESHVSATLDSVISTLGAVVDAKEKLPARPSPTQFTRGARLLERNTRHIFGPPRPGRDVRIMVTFGTEAADSYDLVHSLVARGMDCARINCAHDSPDVWRAMIDNVKRAGRELGRRVRVSMDVAGPKARTGEVITPVDRDRMEIGDAVLLTSVAPTPRADAAFQARCSLPEFLDAAAVGSMVWIDDGRVGLHVEGRENGDVRTRVKHLGAKGRRLREGKGLNFPGAIVQLCPLTSKDLTDLDFVAANADIVGYSFVKSAADVELMQRELALRLSPGAPPPPVMLKVETEAAVRNLPEIIIQAGGRQPVAVMIARGDLAVEIGFHRLAEMQEEILWLCEAANVPVIWATQVLENLAQKGLPSRAEITDAAMAERAECVMLNKGPFILDAVSTLDDVLTRMEAHQHKKTAQLRALRAWAGR